MFYQDSLESRKNSKNYEKMLASKVCPPFTPKTLLSLCRDCAHGMLQNEVPISVRPRPFAKSPCAYRNNEGSECGFLQSKRGFSNPSVDSSIPTGLRPKAQGWRGTHLPWVNSAHEMPQPQRGCVRGNRPFKHATSHHLMTQPRWG